MIKPTSHIAHSSKAFEPLSFQFGDIGIVCRTEKILQVKLPMSTVAVQEVIVNGEVFYRLGQEQQIVRIAPVKYPDVQFREVNGLVEQKYYSKESAIRDVADKYGYDMGNFRRQYYDRKGSLMGAEEPK